MTTCLSEFCRLIKASSNEELFSLENELETNKTYLTQMLQVTNRHLSEINREFSGRTKAYTRTEIGVRTESQK